MEPVTTGFKFELTPGKWVLYLNGFAQLAMFRKNNYSQPVSRSRHLTCAFDYSKASGKGMISWLLILIMIVGPFQASFARHTNLNTPDRQPPALVAQLQEAVVDIEEHHCIADYCQQLAACAAHFNCAPASLTSPPQLSLQTQFYHHHLVADIEVSTRFPALLKRPPRS